MTDMKLGEQTPNLSLTSVTGDPMNLDEQRRQNGHWQLLLFFRGAW
ncbi:hypothetical protein C8P63_102222 [Melghirimyces profundicolus]|uniref:AhpC/TSA family protein n=1 Tax=Melghirimyces profundicolus TaxID=1242148 RepID=A0A2T6C8T1_9BACL|nr:hypothetical protein [Melghirimyces profundicolus]PTX64727.1 hypothetical protein C8P63_102222 [Melghirimyces profundicolus]